MHHGGIPDKVFGQMTNHLGKVPLFIALATSAAAISVASVTEAMECDQMFLSSRSSTVATLDNGRIHWQRFEIRRHVIEGAQRNILVRSGIFESTDGPIKGLKVAFEYSRHTLRGASRPSVVLLHGVFNRREDLAKLSQEFQIRGWNVVAIDLLGHGRTAFLNQPHRSAPIHHKTQVDALASLVEQLHGKMGLKNPLIVGHSLGGGISMLLSKELAARGIRPMANVPVTPFLSSIDKFLIHHGLSADVLIYFNERLVENLGLRVSDKNQMTYLDHWANFFRVLYEPALLALDAPQFRYIADFFQTLNEPLSHKFLEKAYRRYHEIKSASDLASSKISESELEVLIRGAIDATQGVRSLDFQARQGATKLDPSIPVLLVSADRDQVVIPPQIRDFKEIAKMHQYDMTFVELKGDHHLPQHSPAELTDTILDFLVERGLLP